MKVKNDSVLRKERIVKRIIMWTSLFNGVLFLGLILFALYALMK